MSNEQSNDKVRCEICGNYYQSLTLHIRKHNKMTIAEYRLKFPSASIVSKSIKDNLLKCSKEFGGFDKGHLPWNKGQVFKIGTRAYDAAKNHAIDLKCRYNSGELVIWNKGLNKNIDDRIAKCAEKNIVSHLGNINLNKGKTLEEIYGVDKAASMRSKMSNGQLRVWKDPEHASKMIKAQQKSPNNEEIKLLDIVEKLFPGRFIHIKKVDIKDIDFDGLVPDLIDIKNKLIILHHGCFWHCCDSCGFGNIILPSGMSSLERKQRDMESLKRYNNLGWQVLVIWEHELYEDMKILNDKIIDFVEAILTPAELA